MAIATITAGVWGSTADQTRQVSISTTKTVTITPSWYTEIWKGGVHPPIFPSTIGWRRACV